ncbi:RNF146 [Cordylochernes scorpioides]|uniref:E3 ubiquitin-protein ligase n=1 Tax=Cordylochernes scorpioides TaxID=51811 RepID=A0ABY6KC41_9ARAC|nr:RNF146 [Cordylochernes scorpioides]
MLPVVATVAATECAICLQPPCHPVVLPCSHAFCFLCAKGICNLRQKCAMCRKGYGGAASVLMLESASKASASMLGTASNYRQSQTFTKVCLDHGNMINESCTPTPHSMRSAHGIRSIPPDYILNPKFLTPEEVPMVTEPVAPPPPDSYQWFYEGRNGWWQYDDRTSEELEQAYTNKETKCDILVAGFLYTVDFEHMMQYRQHEPGRRRRIKRDRADATKKGVAGIRASLLPSTSTGDVKDTVQDSPPSTSKDISATQDSSPSTADKDGPVDLSQPLTTLVLGDDDPHQVQHV